MTDEIKRTSVVEKGIGPTASEIFFDDRNERPSQSQKLFVSFVYCESEDGSASGGAT